MNYPEQVETERLVLRWHTEVDAEELFARCTSDPVMTKFLLWPAHQSADETREYIRLRVAERGKVDDCGWLLRLKSDGSIIGSIGCRRVEKHMLQFGYYIAQSAWGNGYATEATRAMVPIWLANDEICRVQAFCDPENVASARVLAKSGLILEGRLRRYILSPNLGPEPRDGLLFAAVKELVPANVAGRTP